MASLRPLLPRLPTALFMMALATGLSAGAATAHADDRNEHGKAALPRAQLSEIRGQYTLADGRRLTMTGSAYKIRAQLDGRPETVVAPAGGAVFRAVDGSLSLHFEQYANGNVTGVTLVETPGPASASRPVPVAGAR